MAPVSLILAAASCLRAGAAHVATQWQGCCSSRSAPPHNHSASGSLINAPGACKPVRNTRPYGHYLFVIGRNKPDRHMASVKFRSGRKARLQVLERKKFTGDG